MPRTGSSLTDKRSRRIPKQRIAPGKKNVRKEAKCLIQLRDLKEKLSYFIRPEFCFQSSYHVIVSAADGIRANLPDGRPVSAPGLLNPQTEASNPSSCIRTLKRWAMHEQTGRMKASLRIQMGEAEIEEKDLQENKRFNVIRSSNENG